MDLANIGRQLKASFPNSGYATVPDEILGEMYASRFGKEGAADPFGYLGGTPGNYLGGDTPDPFVDSFDPSNPDYLEEDWHAPMAVPGGPVAPITGRGITPPSTQTPSATLAPPRPQAPATPFNYNPGGSVMENRIKKEVMGIPLM